MSTAVLCHGQFFSYWPFFYPLNLCPSSSQPWVLGSTLQCDGHAGSFSSVHFTFHESHSRGIEIAVLQLHDEWILSLYSFFTFPPSLLRKLFFFQNCSWIFHDTKLWIWRIDRKSLRSRRNEKRNLTKELPFIFIRDNQRAGNGKRVRKWSRAGYEETCLVFDVRETLEKL